MYRMMSDLDRTDVKAYLLVLARYPEGTLSRRFAILKEVRNTGITFASVCDIRV